MTASDTRMLNSALAMLDEPPTNLKEMLTRSVILAALENLIRLDDCPVFRAAARARYFDLTDGRAPK